MKWKDKVFREIAKEIYNDKEWSDITNKLNSGRNDFGVHVAIFSEPYLTLVLKGEKTVESRFSINRISPFGRIYKGDLVLLKKAGGPIVGMFICGDVLFFSKLNKQTLKNLENIFAKQICSYVDEDFWESRINCKYATLINIEKVRGTFPIQISKSDRTAWSIVQSKFISLFDNL